MTQDWNLRALKNARFYVANGSTDWTDEEFFLSGEKTVAEDVLADLDNICQGKSPQEMRVLEIGCGPGRVTRALAKAFGEVHAVDISEEMILRAKVALAGIPNAHIYRNNGMDLSVVPSCEFDFAYSSLVFQHIPSREVIESYVGEVSRLLKPGCLFKFQVQGVAGRSSWFDTWHGVAFSEHEAHAMAERNGFEARYSYGAKSQYFWLWYFRKH